MDIYVVVIGILLILSCLNLIVGVSNDAINFLNSSIGSRVAPRHVIMIVASLGILMGVTFSSGMMEVARKGIFHPQFFTMPELLTIFIAVMFTNLLLLDLYNTFGLPTSTTVSIVFELIGAAVAISLIKIINNDGDFATLGKYINTGKALMIISGILLSVVIAFFFGALVQYITRLLFTFDYKKRLKRYGSIWCGISISIIFYFILIKGSKGSSFMTKDTITWIKANKWMIMSGIFAISVIKFQLLQIFTKINILKPTVLVGTFALSMAFAANDLVNFIGVPLAGLSSYKLAHLTADPLNTYMVSLQKAVQTDTVYLIIAGLIMVVTLWLSKKAKTVAATEIGLGRQEEEGYEKFESMPLSRVLVRMVYSFSEMADRFIPSSLRKKIASRFDYDGYIKKSSGSSKEGETQSFDLLRASVNLMVASAVISYATSMKLPLSTTYVTFMVSMGASLSDRAWGRESAVYRVSGVITVIGGWFFTAVMAFTFSLIFAFLVYYFQMYAIVGLICLAGLIIWKNHRHHSKKVEEIEEIDVFNIIKVTDLNYGINTSFTHSGIFLQKVNNNLDRCFKGLFAQDRNQLKEARKTTKKVQTWANIVIANIFKTLRLLQRNNVKHSHRYAQIIKWLQGIAESHRDIVVRSFLHIDNNHKEMLDIQVKELLDIKSKIGSVLKDASAILMSDKPKKYDKIEDLHRELKKVEAQLDNKQIERIIDGSSKTRLSILYYGFIENMLKISKYTINLLKLSNELYKIDFNKDEKKVKKRKISKE